MRMRSALPLLAGLVAACSSNPRTATPTVVPPPQSAASVADIPELKPQPGEKVTGYDPSHSGKPNLWRYSILVGEGQERVVRRERDLNGDGKIDMWEALDDEGNVTKVAYDLDFDGRPDLVVAYEKGQLVKKEYSPGFDGRTRSVAYYEGGKLVRKERDSKGTGKIDVWEYWENGELDRVGYDDDGDGQVDRWEKREGSDAAAAAAAAPDAAAAQPAPAADKPQPAPGGDKAKDKAEPK